KIDIQKRDIFLNDSGIKKIETNFNLNNFFSFENYKFNVLMFNSLKALFFFKRGVDYIVDKDNKKIQIIDGSTGRISKNRVYKDGIQQAIEVKEGLKASKIRKTITEITYPSFFRMFKKISGMSGTAKSEENEFKSVYGMNVVKIHSYNKLIRRDKKDIIFPNNKERSDEVLRIIKDNLKNDKRPIFIGVHDLETSEHFSSILKLSKIDHYKINAENHEQEAEAVAKAGEIGSITIATVMGGRGTDIVLSNESKEKGGLKIIVIGKSVISDRIDKQFIGRGGRKGDPGESQFFLSLEDDLFKKVFDFRDQIDNKDVFSPVRKLANEIMKDPAVSIFMCDFLNNFINGWLLKFLVSNCQNAIKLEMYINRKNTLEYSLLTNKIRKEFYEYREEILMLEGDELIRFILEDDNFHIKVKDDTLYEQLRRLLLMNSDNFWSKHLNSAERKLETIFIKSYFPKPPQEAFFLEINEDFKKNFKTFKLINKVIMLRKISDNFKETNQ
ncbi:MAG TPA: hypothetical protein VN854_00800, partial [Mycoplasmatales bacterium]|nr:hypothetical protein [Mycoplasmatales bacterium]